MIKILLAGQGGQGVLSAGKFLAESGLHEGKEVTYLPAYGPEMRGGTANCSVIILNGPSFHKFAPRVKSGGIIIVNGSVSDCYAGRDDVHVYDVAANDIAIETGDVRSANMVMLGAFIALTGAVKEKSIFNCLNEKFVGKPHVCEVNGKAFRAGMQAVR